MICKTCGTDNRKDAKFCVRCGEKLPITNFGMEEDINSKALNTSGEAQENTNSGSDNNSKVILKYIKKHDVVCIIIAEILLLTISVLLTEHFIETDNYYDYEALMGVLSLIVYVCEGGICSFFTLDLDKKNVTFGRFKFKKATKKLTNFGCLGWIVFISILGVIGPGYLLNILIFALIRNNEKRKLMLKFEKSNITDSVANAILLLKDEYIYFGAGLNDVICLNDLEKGELLSAYNYGKEGLPALTSMEAEALTRVLGNRLSEYFSLITIPDPLYPDGLYLLKRKYINNVSRNW